MKINYKLSASDYLKFQLYRASMSKSIKKRIVINRIVWAILFLGLAIFFAIDKYWIGFGIFFSVSILWYFILPFFSKITLKKRYKKEITEKFSAALDKPLSIDATTDGIHLMASQKESLMKYTSISEIVDLDSHYYILFETGSVAILPIGRDVGRNVWTDFVAYVAKKSGKPIYDKKDWEWK